MSLTVPFLQHIPTSLDEGSNYAAIMFRQVSDRNSSRGFGSVLGDQYVIFRCAWDVPMPLMRCLAADGADPIKAGE